MILHSDEKTLLCIDENNPDQVVCVDLEAGKVSDSFRVSKGQSLCQIVNEFKNAQCTPNSTFVAANDHSIMKVDPRINKEFRGVD